MTLGELLGGDLRLVVPSYQRSYAWTISEAGQLLDDLLLARGDAQDEEADYFLGALVLMDTAYDAADRTSGAAPVLEIVDGLQRLVTITILLAVLRDIAEEEDTLAFALSARCIAAPESEPSTGRHLKLVLSGDTQAFFNDFVQEPRATSAMPNDDNLASPEARLLEVREHLLERLLGESAARRRQLVQMLLGHTHCAVIVARTLDRAHQIFAVLNDRGRPLARGDILKAQILGSVPPERRAPVEERWSDMERRLGGSLEELFSHLRTIEGRSRSRIIDEIRGLVERSANVESFVEGTLLPYAEVLETIRSQKLAEARLGTSAAARLMYVGWLGSHDWMPPLMLFWRVVEGRVADLDPFLARLDRLAYGLRLLGIGSDKRMIRYRALLDSIRTGTLNDPTSPLELTRDEQRLIAYNLRTLHARSQLACKLVLLRLNDIIAGAPQNLDPADFTVEHILPQKPGRNSQWRDWFPSADERERCTQSIGNLILVSRDKNEEARNLELSRKLAIYFDGRTPQPRITQEIQGLETWRPEDVKQREDRLVGLLNELWQFGGRGAAATPESLQGLPMPRPRRIRGRATSREEATR